MTLGNLIPMARGAWLRATLGVVEICNAIPKFGHSEPLRLKDLDQFLLLDEDYSATSAIPYDPSVMQSLQERIGE